MATIEQKARAYDEALEKSKRLYEQGTITESLAYIFPELAESEDEKIRKELIEHVKDQQSSFISAPDCRDKYEEEENNKYNSWIAWLEKQNSNVDNANKEYWRGYREGKQEILDKYAELEKQGEQNLVNFHEAEKEKNDFVSGNFIQCRKSFNEFKEGESYWFEYIGDDIYIGRSDNILNKKFHITPRQLFKLFSLEHCYKQEEEQISFPQFTFNDILALQCCMETVKKVQEDKELYEKLNNLHGRVYDAYRLEK